MSLCTMTVPFHIPVQQLETPTTACSGSPHNALHSATVIAYTHIHSSITVLGCTSLYINQYLKSNTYRMEASAVDAVAQMPNRMQVDSLACKYFLAQALH